MRYGGDFIMEMNMRGHACKDLRVDGLTPVGLDDTVGFNSCLTLLNNKCLKS